MSTVIPQDVHQSLVVLVGQLMAGDTVTAAEKTLETDWIDTRPDTLLMALVEQLRTSTDLKTKPFLAVLFRKMSMRQIKTSSGEMPELFLSLQKAQRDVIRAELLQCFLAETDKATRDKVSDAIAEIARQYVEGDLFTGTRQETWTELLGALFQASQSSESDQRLAAFRIFSTTPGIIEKQHEEVVIGAFAKGFKDDTVAVQLAAMQAFSAFFSSLQKKQQQKYYNLVGDILNILPPLHEKGLSDDLKNALLEMMNIGEEAPRMFKPLFSGLVTFCISVVQDTKMEDDARQNALETLTTFAEVSPQMCKNEPTYAEKMVTQCLSLMTEVGTDDDDAAEWNESEDLDSEDSDMNHIAGQQTMDRLANKLGGAVILPPTFTWLPRMITSGSWRDRHAALMALSSISEGCQELMEAELAKVLQMVVPALDDPHPRVRWAACNALGQMSTDFKGTMQTEYHQTVLPSLIPKLLAPEARVASHAAAALVNFCEEAEKEILDPYLDAMLRNLLILSSNPKQYVQEQALSTIATVADSAESRFSKYYDELMPLLFKFLHGEYDKDRRLLRAKAMECATLIALAVGRERMGNDGRALVEVLGSIQQGIVDDDDPQAGYLLHCWGRMCRVLGVEFLPYLPAVMPPLLTLAKARADVQVLDDEEDMVDEGWEILPLKGKYIGIKTSTLEDKNTAIELIVIYAQHLQEHFEPYVLDVMENIAIPGLAFFFHDPVRAASAKCVPQLLSSYKAAHGLQSPEFQQLWKSTIDKVLEVLGTEPGIETLAEMYQCFYESVEVCGKGSLSVEHMTVFVESAQSVLDDYKKRVAERQEEAKDRDDGEEPDEDTLFAIEDDQTLLSDMNKAFHTVFKNAGVAFLPYWERLMPLFDELLASQDATQRQWALCVMDDMCEFCGDQSFKYNAHIIQPFVRGIQDPAAPNRQAACYGVGVAAEHGGPAWSEFASGTLPLLFAVCQAPNAREEESAFATENACASIAKILHNNASKVQNVDQVTAAWVQTLPVVNDDEAAPFAYSLLAQLIDQRNPAVMSNAAQCFVYIAKALEAEMLQGQTAARTIEAAKRLISNAGLDAGQLLASLPESTQHVVRASFG